MRVKRRNEFDECHNHAKYDICGMAFFSSICFKVGTHEGTSRRDLSQGLVRCRGLHDGTSRGDKSLEGFTRGDLLHIEIAKFRAPSLKFRET